MSTRTSDPHDPVGCRYIEGDPHGVWSYCQETQREGSSYCERHHARCFRRASDAEAREIRAVLRKMRRAA